MKGTLTLDLVAIEQILNDYFSNRNIELTEIEFNVSNTSNSVPTFQGITVEVDLP